ncbi:hypothetical protein CKAH01_05936 [Colletotrichum kahawae]|uniref:Uncharacterized protein n=1 Tax=Colletotrichum kahawae TaxID=34407 RepID=A0AAD9YCA0_COLKA|nr:hypothetical protein CKAH01_05936 [Colletotrichum kahawae]
MKGFNWVSEAIDDPHHIKFAPQPRASHSLLSQPRSVSLQPRQKYIYKLDRRAPQSEILLGSLIAMLPTKTGAQTYAKAGAKVVTMDDSWLLRRATVIVTATSECTHGKRFPQRHGSFLLL